MGKGLIKVKQTRSPIRRPGNQRACLIGLGLNRIGRVARHENTSAIRGMIRKVRYLVCVLIELGERYADRKSPSRHP
jgi:large subunit ribosomal protein L30